MVTKENPPGVEVPASVDRVILDNGTCSTCKDDDATSSAVCCFHCNRNFHAICKDPDNNNGVNLDNNICTKTFYTTFITRTTQSERSGNFWFRCNSCATTYEQDQASDTRTQVKSLESKIGNLESDISDIKDILLSKTNTLSPRPLISNDSNTSPNTTAVNVWDDLERVKQIRSSVKTIISKGTDTSKSKTILSKSDLEEIARKNAVHVDNTLVNEAGETVIVFPTQNDRDKFNTELKNSFPDSEFRKIGEMLPTISIANISTQMTPQNLQEAIFNYHPQIKLYVDNGGVFKVLGKELRKQNNNELFQANVRVSNNIRKYIDLNGNRIYVGFGERCKVYDHFHVKRCNNCQQFNHFKDNCKSLDKPVCAHCAQDHKTDDCQHASDSSFVPTCHNCKSNNNGADTRHAAFWARCPTYKDAQIKLEKSIMYYSNESKNI